MRSRCCMTVSILLISADNQQMTFLNVISFLFVLISWYMWVISLFGSVFCRDYRSPKFGPRPKKPKGEVVFFVWIRRDQTAD